MLQIIIYFIHIFLIKVHTILHNPKKSSFPQDLTNHSATLFLTYIHKTNSNKNKISTYFSAQCSFSLQKLRECSILIINYAEEFL